jgi:AbrB family looped-hinge helix DNA binding protein
MNQTITVTQKGQVVIPAKIRQLLHIKKGTKLMVKQDASGILLTPVEDGYISAMKGALKADESMTEFLLNERFAETTGMDRKWKR